MSNIIPHKYNYGGGSKCSFKNCTNSTFTTRGLIPVVRFYGYPVKYTNRCMEWIIRSGRDDLLDLDPNKLQKREVCSRHFSPSQKLGMRLCHDAIPFRYDDLGPIPTTSKANDNPVPSSEVNVGTSNCKGIEDVDHVDETMPEPSVGLQGVENDKCVSMEVDDSEEKLVKLNNTRSSLYRYNKKRVKPACINAAHNALNEVIDGDAMTFVSMLIRQYKPVSWNNEQKKLALSLFYKSPSLYHYMKDELKFNLPSYSTIKRWML